METSVSMVQTLTLPWSPLILEVSASPPPLTTFSRTCWTSFHKDRPPVPRFRAASVLYPTLVIITLSSGLTHSGFSSQARSTILPPLLPHSPQPKNTETTTTLCAPFMLRSSMNPSLTRFKLCSAKCSSSLSHTCSSSPPEAPLQPLQWALTLLKPLKSAHLPISLNLMHSRSPLRTLNSTKPKPSTVSQSRKPLCLATLRISTLTLCSISATIEPSFGTQLACSMWMPLKAAASILPLS